jgi:epoxyqueuosine reductase
MAANTAEPGNGSGAEPSDPRAAIRTRALELGFDAVGFAPPAVSEAARAGLAQFLSEGWHGDMGWLAANAERRSDPTLLWPEARSIVLLGVNYGPPGARPQTGRPGEQGAIAAYARGRDYHDVIKKRLKSLARWIHEALGAEVKVFVDTAAVMEKPLAARAGLGWQGKHTNLVARQFGSWLLLGEVFTNLDLPADAAETDRCGTCQACLDICPTRAFPAPYRLDARRCISYLTIEHRGHIPREFRATMQNRIFGCDDCLAVCPWNRFARAGKETALMPRAELTAPLLADLVGLDDGAFRARFAGTAVKRTGRDRFVRNVLIAIGNSGDAAMASAVRPLLNDASPLVRAMAVWALSRLLDQAAFAQLRARHAGREQDSAVLAEWHEAQPAE